MQQYRRSIFLINRGFQLKFAFFTCSWLFALSIAYPMIIYSLFDYFMRYISADPNGPALTTIQQTRQEMIWLLVLLQVIFLTVTFLISIFMSHKIAGPLYKLRKFLEGAKGGDISQELYFRKGDHFTELARAYNEMTAGVRARVATISEPIARIERALAATSGEARADLEAALTKLREVQKISTGS